MTAIETAAVPVRRLEWQLAEVREIVVEMLHVTSWQDIGLANTSTSD